MDSNLKTIPLSITISILNWNGSSKTISCINSLETSVKNCGINIKLRIIDNGSSLEDFSILQNRIRRPELTRLEKNVGFAAGHNLSIHAAIRAGDDYIWLLNNDCILEENPLPEMIRIMESDQKCGGVSPVILEKNSNAETIDFLSSYHDWDILQSIRLKDFKLAEATEQSQPKNMWIAGTAPLYRISALKEIGGFDQNFFAYFEDNDLGVRLSNAGWNSRIAYNTRIFHGAHDNIANDRPPYYFYLMTRNSFLFWIKHSNPQNIPRNYIRLLARALWKARELNDLGQISKRDACLNGLADGLRMRGGEPLFERNPNRYLIKAAKYFPHRALKLLDGA